MVGTSNSLDGGRQRLYVQNPLASSQLEFLNYLFRCESADLHDVLFIWAYIFELHLRIGDVVFAQFHRQSLHHPAVWSCVALRPKALAELTYTTGTGTSSN